MELKVQFKGLLKSPASWAKVSREILRQLTDQEKINLRVEPTRGWQWKKSFKIPASLRERTGSFEQPDVQLMFAYPPRLENYREPDVSLWNFSVYEASRLPPGWAKNLNEHCQKVLVPSTHTRKVYRESGVREEYLEQIPYGFNQQLFKKIEPVTEPGTELKLLTVATPHHRKGLDLINSASNLLDKYNLSWQIHLPYQPETENPQFWENPDICKKLDQNGFQLTTGHRSDQEMVHLYQTADLVVQPSRSEGFGLAILEAMAAGRGVVTTNWGGQLDFAGPGMLRVEGELRSARNCQYDGKNPEAKVFEPDREKFKKTLKNLLASPKKLSQLGEKAKKTVEQWTWGQAAKELSQVLLENFKSP